MQRNWLTLLLFGLFLVQSTILKWLIPEMWQTGVKVAPQLTLVVVLLIGLYANRHVAMLYGLGFGLLHDIVFYGPMIGTYTFTMGLLGYLAGLIGLRANSSMLTGLFVLALGDLLFHWILFGIYRLFRITHISTHWVFFHQMLPSLLIDLLFALLIYVPVRKLLEGLALEEKPEED